MKPQRHDGHGARRIALLSDSHGVIVAPLRERLANIDLIVHAGDVGAQSVLATLSGIAPLCAVAGNNDTPRQWPPGEAEACHALPEALSVALDGGELVVVHGHQFAKVSTRHERLRKAFPTARCIVYGHSHRRCLDLGALPWVVNPGASGKARAHGGAGGLLVSIGADCTWSIDAL